MRDTRRTWVETLVIRLITNKIDLDHQRSLTMIPMWKPLNKRCCKLHKVKDAIIVLIEKSFLTFGFIFNSSVEYLPTG